jgi:hypothetical protein
LPSEVSVRLCKIFPKTNCVGRHTFFCHRPPFTIVEDFQKMRKTGVGTLSGFSFKYVFLGTLCKDVRSQLLNKNRDSVSDLKILMASLTLDKVKLSNIGPVQCGISHIEPDQHCILLRTNPVRHQKLNQSSTVSNIDSVHYGI